MELQTRLDNIMLIALDLSLVKCRRFCDSKQTPQVETLAFHLILSPLVQIQMKILIEEHINILFSVVSSSNCDEQVHVECSWEDGPNQFKCFHFMRRVIFLRFPVQFSHLGSFHQKI